MEKVLTNPSNTKLFIEPHATSLALSHYSQRVRETLVYVFRDSFWTRDNDFHLLEAISIYTNLQAFSLVCNTRDSLSSPEFERPGSPAI